MTFGFRRSGSFGGFGSLDPFGTSRGGLGRYNLGSDIASIEAYEAYVIAVGWSNGTVSDADYLASLQRQIDLAPTGSRDKVTAQDKLDDAVYNIERNKLVRAANNADTEAERKDALRALIGHDRSRLGAMAPDNEQRRELEDRIESTRSDIRSIDYGLLVERYNHGQATTRQLLAFAREAFAETAGTAEQIEWRRTLADLEDRSRSETLAQKMHDYQNDNASADSVLSELDRQMRDLLPDSPEWQELARQRENLSRRERDLARQRSSEAAYRAHASGKISDAEYLETLHDEVANAKPGSDEERDAKWRLRQAAFSLTEDRLRYRISRGKATAAEIGALARFYRNAQRGMDPGSERYRALQLAIDRLTGGGAVGGGGGGGGAGGGGDWLKAAPKLLSESSFASVLGGSRTYDGKPLTKQDQAAIAKLFRVNPSNVAARSWFRGNLDAMTDAWRQGADSWTFFTPLGKLIRLPFDVNMLVQLTDQRVQQGVWQMANAKTLAERVAAQRAIMVAARDARDLMGNLTMDQTRQAFEVLNDAKRDALVMGDLTAYANIVAEQNALIRETMGLDPTDIDPNSPQYVASGVNQNPVLSATDVDWLTGALESLQPAQLDPLGGKVVGGDDVMTLLERDIIRLKPGVGGGEFAEGESMAVPYAGFELDEAQAFFEQDPVTGQVTLRNVLREPELFDLVTEIGADGNEVRVPAYRAHDPADPARPGRVPLQLYNTEVGAPGTAAGAEARKTVLVWQRVTDTGVGVRIHDLSVPIKSGSAPGNRAAGQNRKITGPVVPLATVTTYEWVNGRREPVQWMSLNPGVPGAVWVRVTKSGGLPQVVANRTTERNQFGQEVGTPLRVTWDAVNGLQVEGQKVTPAALAANFHIYGDADATSRATIGIGGPGMDFEYRVADNQGRIHADVPIYGRPERELIGEPGVDAIWRFGRAPGRTTAQQRRQHDVRTPSPFAVAVAGEGSERNLDKWDTPPPSRADPDARRLPPGYPAAGPAWRLPAGYPTIERRTSPLFNERDIAARQPRQFEAQGRQASRTELRSAPRPTYTRPTVTPATLAPIQRNLDLREIPTPKLKPVVRRPRRGQAKAKPKARPVQKAGGTPIRAPGTTAPTGERAELHVGDTRR